MRQHGAFCVAVAASGSQEGERDHVRAFCAHRRGLASLQPPLVISRNGGGADRLPTAHTCFNHLLLPAYTVVP